MPPRPHNPFSKLIDAIQETFMDAVEEQVSTVFDDIRTRIPDPRVLDSFITPHGIKPHPRVKRPANKRNPPRPIIKPPAPAPTPTPTLYDALEVSPHASPETISAAFRSLSRRFHPDNFSGKKEKGEAEERMKGITGAWAVLKDEGKRGKYDREIGVKK